MQKFKLDIHFKETGKEFPTIEALGFNKKEILIEKIYRILGEKKLEENLFQYILKVPRCRTIVSCGIFILF